MNAREMVARLNDLDEQLCGAFRVPRSGDATRCFGSPIPVR
jgi:hypothetical protein